MGCQNARIHDTVCLRTSRYNKNENLSVGQPHDPAFTGICSRIVFRILYETKLFSSKTRTHSDKIVLNYDKIRPEYPDKLCADIFEPLPEVFVTFEVTKISLNRTDAAHGFRKLMRHTLTRKDIPC